MSALTEFASLMAARVAHGGKMPPVDLTRFNHILSLAPADMTTTVETGLTLGALQTALGAHRQWLPIDPPDADKLSIHELLSKDLSGPRRYGCGTIREHVIGLRVLLADGRSIKCGGIVVKNVAGYDLAKLFIGARDSLGVIVEATFKVRPRPEMEQIISASVPVAKASQIMRAVIDSDLTPIILDMHGLADAKEVTMVLGFAGTREDVEWQAALARGIGFTTPGTPDYEAQFWSGTDRVHRTSVLPTRLMETVVRLGNRPFVARAGNGAIHYRGEKLASSNSVPVNLSKRIKATYDPNNILPEFDP
jgi:FAD/FMN-containing dehydrogenase